MSLHLIVGHGANNHVTSNNMRHMYAQIYGTAGMVFDCGNKFGYVLVDNNTFRVKDGEGCIEGAYFEEPYGSYDDLTIESGQQGMYRRDLVCARYQKEASTGIETMSLVVVKGTASVSAARDPAVNTGSILNGAEIKDFPLYRININGLNITKVDTLFTVYPSIVDMIELFADSLGTQVTYSLSGTTLTITTK